MANPLQPLQATLYGRYQEPIAGGPALRLSSVPTYNTKVKTFGTDTRLKSRVWAVSPGHLSFIPRPSSLANQTLRGRPAVIFGWGTSVITFWKRQAIKTASYD